MIVITGSTRQEILTSLNEHINADAKTLTAIANRAGVSRSQLWEILNTHQNPTMTTMEKILKALDIGILLVPRDVK